MSSAVMFRFIVWVSFCIIPGGCADVEVFSAQAVSVANNVPLADVAEDGPNQAGDLAEEDALDSSVWEEGIWFLRGSRRLQAPPRDLISWGSRRRRASGSYGSGSYSGARNRDHGSPLTEMIIGCCLWCCFLPMFICQNERIALKQAKLQGRASRHCVIVDDEAVDREPIEELEGHILFVSGDATCEEQLQDGCFPAVTTTNCIKLRRVVEMYQWVEEHHEEHHEDEHHEWYTHSLIWSDMPESCPNGGPDKQNPPMPIPSSQRGTDNYRASAAASNLASDAMFKAGTENTSKVSNAGEPCAEASRGGVRLGAYYLGQYVIRELGQKWKNKSVGLAEIQSCDQLRGMAQPQQSGQTWWMFGPDRQLGSVRVRFEELQCGPVSVCGILDHTATGWSFVPVFREDENNFDESLAEEFGCRQGTCPCCPAGEELNFTAHEGDDEDLKEALDRVAPELTQREREQFRTADTSYNQPWYKGGGDDSFLTSGMHFAGLEEEFLGVKEMHMTHDQMMAMEGTDASRRHNCARVCATFTGCAACFCILSPITTFLNSNWLIYILGGGCISCLLQCISSICSCFCTTTLIMCAWVKERPRMVCITMTLLTVVIGLMVVISRTIFPAEDADYQLWNQNNPAYNQSTGPQWGMHSNQL